MDKLIELAERCEKSPSNSWDLDREIFKALFLPDVWFGSKVISWFGNGPFGCNTEDGIRHLDCINAPNYTASIDAAMTLKPAEANSWGFDEWPGGCEASWGRNNVASGHWCVLAEAKTPALALCAAALRARAKAAVSFSSTECETAENKGQWQCPK